MKPPASNREWIFWGKSDPLFGVLTRVGRDRDGPNPWSLDEVRTNGAVYFAAVFRHLMQYGARTGHCVEIGCGCGRITAQLEQHFARVTALDVSPEQLALAATMLAERAATVDLRLVDAPTIPVADGECDVVFSCEVFQHLESFATIEAYLREAARVLRPGGVICVQIPVAGIHNAGLLGSPLRNAILRGLRRAGRRRMMIYRLYPAHQVLATLEQSGFVDCELHIFRPDDHDGYHGYYFAKR
jgi:SAM-dependent methyltransferase